jgi:hypothetical protein
MKRSGVGLLEQMPRTNRSKPGTAAEDEWRPYKLWIADLWECKGCGHALVFGYGQPPVAEHFQADFQEQLTAASAKTEGVPIIVNDC